MMNPIIKLPNLQITKLIPLWRLLRWGSPLPIPNREVKPTCADGTWPKARESMTMPILKKDKPPFSNEWGFFRLYNPLPKKRNYNKGKIRNQK